MARFKLVNGELIQLTPQEEIDREAEEAAAAVEAARSQAAVEGERNFKASIERQAQELEDAGDTIGAVLLRLKHNLL